MLIINIPNKRHCDQHVTASTLCCLRLCFRCLRRWWKPSLRTGFSVAVVVGASCHFRRLSAPIWVATSCYFFSLDRGWTREKCKNAREAEPKTMQEKMARKLEASFPRVFSTLRSTVQEEIYRDACSLYNWASTAFSSLVFPFSMRYVSKLQSLSLIYWKKSVKILITKSSRFLCVLTTELRESSGRYLVRTEWRWPNTNASTSVGLK